MVGEAGRAAYQGEKSLATAPVKPIMETRAKASGAGAIQWVYEYDEGVDPGDPAVRSAAREALDAMRRDVGLP